MFGQLEKDWGITMNLLHVAGEAAKSEGAGGKIQPWRPITSSRC